MGKISSAPISALRINGQGQGVSPWSDVDLKSHQLTVENSFPVESNASLGIRTGVAISNPGSDPVVVPLTLHNESGMVVPNANTTISLRPRSQSSRFLDEIFAGRGIDFSRFKGTLEVNATAPVGGLAIRTSPGELATLPITTVACDACK